MKHCPITTNINKDFNAKVSKYIDQNKLNSSIGILKAQHVFNYALESWRASLNNMSEEMFNEMLQNENQEELTENIESFIEHYKNNSDLLLSEYGTDNIINNAVYIENNKYILYRTFGNDINKIYNAASLLSDNILTGIQKQMLQRYFEIEKSISAQEEKLRKATENDNGYNNKEYKNLENEYKELIYRNNDFLQAITNKDKFEALAIYIQRYLQDDIKEILNGVIEKFEKLNEKEQVDDMPTRYGQILSCFRQLLPYTFDKINKSIGTRFILSLEDNKYNSNNNKIDTNIKLINLNNIIYNNTQAISNNDTSKNLNEIDNTTLTEEEKDRLNDTEEQVNNSETAFSIKQDEIHPLSRMSSKMKMILSQLPNGTDDMGHTLYYDVDTVYSILLYEASEHIFDSDDFCIINENGEYEFPFLDKLEKSNYYFATSLKETLKRNPRYVATFYTCISQDFYQYVTLNKYGTINMLNHKTSDAFGTFVLNQFQKLYINKPEYLDVIRKHINEIRTLKNNINDNGLYYYDREKNQRTRDYLMEAISAIETLYKDLNINRFTTPPINVFSPFLIMNKGNLESKIYKNDEVGNVIRVVTGYINALIGGLDVLSDKNFDIDNINQKEFIERFKDAQKLLHFGEKSKLVFKNNNKMYASFYHHSILSDLQKRLSSNEKAKTYFEELKKYSQLWDGEKFTNYILNTLYKTYIEKGNIENFLNFVYLNSGCTLLSNPATYKGQNQIEYNYLSAKEDECIQFFMYLQGYIPTPILSESKKTAYFSIKKWMSETFNKGSMIESFVNIAIREYNRMNKNISGDMNNNSFVYLPFLNGKDEKGYSIRNKIAEMSGKYKRKKTNESNIRNYLKDIIQKHLDAQVDTFFDNVLKNQHIMCTLLTNKNDKILQQFSKYNNNKNKFYTDNNELINYYKNNPDADFNSDNFTNENDESKIKKLDDKQKEDLKKKVEEYFYTYLLLQSEMQQMVSGDLCFYKSADDYYKRAKQQITSGQGFFTNSLNGKKQESCIYIEDRTNASTVYDSIKEILEQAKRNNNLTEQEVEVILTKWRNINNTDGQSFRTIKSWKRLLAMQGKLSNTLEQAIARIEQNKATRDDFFIMLNEIKPFLFSYENRDGYRVPVIHKNAEMLLLPFFANGTLANNNILKALESFTTKNDIDVVVYGSCVKVGNPNTIQINYSLNKINEVLNKKLTKKKTLKEKIDPNNELDNLENEQPKIDEFIKKLSTALSNNNITQEQYNNIIEEITPTTEEIIETLNEKCIKEDNTLNTEFVYSHPYEDKKLVSYPSDHWQGRVSAPNQMTDPSQARSILFLDISDDAKIKVGNKTYSKNELKKLYDELYIEKVRRAYNRISRRLKDKQHFKQYICELIQKNPSVDKELLMNFTNLDEDNYGKIPLDNPLLQKTIEQLLLVEFNDLSRIKVTGGSLFLMADTSNQLQVETKDGVITGVECYVPFMYKGMLQKYIKEDNGKLTIDNEAINSEHPELLQMIMSRTPTEQKYSIQSLIIKGFLPNTMGATIIVPAEITTMSGIDYDGDKGFIQYYAIKKNRNGNYRKIEYSYDKAPKQQSTLAIDNAILDIKLALMKHSSSMTSIVRTGNFDRITKYALLNQIFNSFDDSKSIDDYAKEFKTKSNKSIQELEKEVAKNNTNLPFAPNTFVDIKHRFAEGTNDIGIFAVNNTAMAKLQSIEKDKKLSVNSNYRFKINDSEITEICSLNTFSGDFTSSKGAEFSAASVDNGKNPQLKPYGVTSKNIKVINFLNATQIDFMDCFLLSNLYNVVTPLKSLKQAKHEYAGTVTKGLENTDINSITTDELIKYLIYIRSNDIARAQAINSNTNNLGINGMAITEIKVRLIMGKLEKLSIDFSKITSKIRNDSHDAIASNSLYEVDSQINAKNKTTSSIDNSDDIIITNGTEQNIETSKLPFDQACYYYITQMAKENLSTLFTTTGSSNALATKKEIEQLTGMGRIPADINNQIVLFTLRKYFDNLAKEDGKGRSYYLNEKNIKEKIIDRISELLTRNPDNKFLTTLTFDNLKKKLVLLGVQIKKDIIRQSLLDILPNADSDNFVLDIFRYAYYAYNLDNSIPGSVSIAFGIDFYKQLTDLNNLLTNGVSTDEISSFIEKFCQQQKNIDLIKNKKYISVNYNGKNISITDIKTNNNSDISENLISIPTKIENANETISLENLSYISYNKDDNADNGKYYKFVKEENGRRIYEEIKPINQTESIYCYTDNNDETTITDTPNTETEIETDDNLLLSNNENEEVKINNNGNMTYDNEDNNTLNASIEENDDVIISEEEQGYSIKDGEDRLKEEENTTLCPI